MRPSYYSLRTIGDVSEGANGGKILLRATRTGNVNKSDTLKWQVFSGSAEYGKDFFKGEQKDFVSGETHPWETISLSPGRSSYDFYLTVADDKLMGGDETLSVTVKSAYSYDDIKF